MVVQLKFRSETFVLSCQKQKQKSSIMLWVPSPYCHCRFLSSPSSYFKQSPSSWAGGWKMVTAGATVALTLVPPFIHRCLSRRVRVLKKEFSRTRSCCSSCLHWCRPLTCCCQASSTYVLGLRTTTLPVFRSMSPSSGECEQSGLVGRRRNDWGKRWQYE